jgi:hypothetical protein
MSRTTWKNTERSTAGRERIPVAILHAHGSRHGGNPCVVRLADLAALRKSGARARR